MSGQTYLGGLIFPGPATALAALSREAAKLPRVNLDISAREPAPGRDTATSIQHGLVFGFVCMVEGLSQRLRRQMPDPVRVLATGGFATSIARVSPVFDEVLPALLLEGLRLFLAVKFWIHAAIPPWKWKLPWSRASTPARLCRPAHPQAAARLWKCATAIRSAMAAKA